ncbi:aldo/keto reductase [Pseudonocardia zijingensis]|jgi:D-threo-aldose 1-dehydrogenase|uniref:Aldo/keto reductase n=1 Tax=Pseudonocardia zijingensis TaxID=153376 RepID=A0ABP4AWA0_9PSEU
MADRVPSLGTLGFGGANLGNLFTAMSDEQANAVLEAAWEQGIRYFDTAPHYGLGLAERRLGRFLAGKPRDEFVVSTKVGRLLVPSPETSDEWDEEGGFVVPADPRRVWDASADGVRRSLDDSLERLGLDRVDVLFLHDPDEYEDMEGSVRSAVPALVGLREEGLVRAVGIGSKSVAAHLAGLRVGDLDLLMVAGRYTLLEQPAAPALIPECRDRGIGIVVAGAFNSGLLSTSTPGPGAHYEYGEAPADVVAKAQRLAAVCAGYGVDLPTAALQFPLREPAVRAIALGATEPAHVEQNVRRLAEPVPDELWKQLVAEGLLP